jgi:peroxiredoxin-like protein
MSVVEKFHGVSSSPPQRMTFETSCRWTGGRSGLIQAGDKVALPVSSPPQFSGDGTKWSPEELLVGAVESCTMATFLALAERNGLPVAWYSSVAEGVLEKVDGKYRVTRVIVRPMVALRPGESAELALQLLRKAHDQCFIGNSLCGQLWFEPAVETFGD